MIECLQQNHSHLLPGDISYGGLEKAIFGDILTKKHIGVMTEVE